VEGLAHAGRLRALAWEYVCRNHAARCGALLKPRRLQPVCVVPAQEVRDVEDDRGVVPHDAISR
jgi:hypothetical protein